MAEIINSKGIYKGQIIFVAPQSVFNKTMYIAYKGSLRGCKVKEIRNILPTHNGACEQAVVAEIAGCGLVELTSVYLYESIDAYKEKKGFWASYVGFYCTSKLGVKKCVLDIINNNIALFPFCSYSQGHTINTPYTYIWNGVKAVWSEFKISNVIVQDKNGFHFEDYDLNADINNYYLTKEDCEESNEINVVDFEDNDNNDNIMGGDKMHSLAYGLMVMLGEIENDIDKGQAQVSKKEVAEMYGMAIELSEYFENK